MNSRTENEPTNTYPWPKLKEIEPLRVIWKTARPIGILLADGFRYLPDGFLCWMLLGVEAFRMGSFPD